ncbi:MAG: DUF3047 domain-containing protein [Gemmatimonadetes bacterium]|nr:DUF3047 domain-containing protein [Gemmatimonadota bacterium]
MIRNIFWNLLKIGFLIFPCVVQAQDRVAVDMGGDWLRRDWDDCGENVTGQHRDGVFAIRSDHAAALFWQVPTKNGTALSIDRSQDWIKRCDRPPRSFGKDVREQAQGQYDLISATEYPYISWRWRVSNTIDDSGTADHKGKIQKSGDDFAAKIGISVLNTRGKLREVAYLWTRTIPEETSLTQVTSVALGIVKYKWYRIVAESGDQNVNQWVGESRNFYRDFKRFYPDEEPAEVVRVYLMSDSDNTGSKVTGAFADLMFHRRPPG